MKSSFVPLGMPDKNKRQPTTVFPRHDGNLDIVASVMQQTASGVFELKSTGVIDEAQMWQHSKVSRQFVHEPTLAESLGIEEVAPEEAAADDDPFRTGAQIPAPLNDEVGPQAFLRTIARSEGCKFVIVLFVHSLDEATTVEYLRDADKVLRERSAAHGGKVICITSQPITDAHLRQIKVSFPLYSDPSCMLAKQYRVRRTLDGKVSYDGLVVVSNVLPGDKEANSSFKSGDTRKYFADDDKAAGLDASTSTAITVAELEEKYDADDPYLSILHQWYASSERANRGRLVLREPAPYRYIVLYGMGMKSIEDGCFLHRRPKPEETWKLLYAVLAHRVARAAFKKRERFFTGKAVKRLMRDWREVERNPLPLIRARPAYDDDIMSWHATVRGTEGTPYHNVPYHLVMEFPGTYPAQPPRVRLLAPIPHKNVFGTHICLDMLTDRVPDPAWPVPLYTGWSSAYSVQSILVQLQAFLFDGAYQYVSVPEVQVFDDDPIKTMRSQKAYDGAVYHNKRIDGSIKMARNIRCECRLCPSKNLAYRPDDEPEKPVIDPEHPPLEPDLPLLQEEEEGWLQVDGDTKPAEEPFCYECEFDTFVPPLLTKWSPFRVELVWDAKTKTHQPVTPVSLIGRVERLMGDRGIGALIDVGLPMPGRRRPGADGKPQRMLVFCHVSQARGQFTSHIKEAMQVGDYVRCRILDVDKKAMRVTVSCKGRMPPLADEVRPDPTVLYEANVSAYTPSGGLLLKFGKVDREGVVDNDQDLTSLLASHGVGHFWHADQVISLGTPVWARLVDVDTTSASSRGRLRFVLTSLDDRASKLRILPSTNTVEDDVDSDAVPFVLERPTLEQTSALRCFYSKLTFRQETLGLALNVEHYPNSGELSYIHVCSCDLLGQTAFEQEGVRRVVSRASFTHWLPLYLDARHGADLSLHERYIAELCRNPKMDRKDEVRQFHWPMVLKVLPALLNTSLVTIMQGHVHESIAALSIYMMIFHLLTAFCRKYPEIQRSVDMRVERFVASTEGRIKDACPSLGEMLAFLCLSSHRWADIGKVMLQEVFSRNAKWAIQKYPELEDLVSDDKIKQERETLEGDYAAIQRARNQKKKDRDSSLTEAQRLKARRAVFFNYQRFGTSGVIAPTKDEDQLADEAASARPVQPDDPDDQDLFATPPKEEPIVYTDPNLTLARLQQMRNLDRGRLVKTLQASLTSLRLVIFHVDFLRNFRTNNNDATKSLDRSVAVRATQRELEQRRLHLETCYGRMSPALENMWQQRVKTLKTIKSWRAFFTHLQLPCPTDDFLLAWLRQSVSNSARLVYHRPSRQQLERMLARRHQVAKKADFHKRLADDGNDYGGAEYEYTEHDFVC